ncbi:MAG: uracil-DNA glycosylase [Nitrosopumilaceae archaeon]|nr:uracil-DNA glycosylase [Nitrosopumilaceae archaeon]
MSITEIQKQVTKCTKCDLCTTRTNAVPGKGNFNADVIFVGEAPGRNEDKKGEPFVGAAGKKLDWALENAGVSRDSIYITNVVKCRPPNNRVPSEHEKDMCKNYLEREISIIEPKIICIMGNTAFGSILGGSDITKNRGKVIRKNSMNYFLTIHPAAVIYNQKFESILKSDIAKVLDIARELKSGKDIDVDYEYTT